MEEEKLNEALRVFAGPMKQFLSTLSGVDIDKLIEKNDVEDLAVKYTVEKVKINTIKTVLKETTEKSLKLADETTDLHKKISTHMACATLKGILETIENIEKEQNDFSGLLRRIN